MNISEKISSLRKKLHDHNYRYYVLDDPIISDYDFDMMLKELDLLERENPEFFDVNSPTALIPAFFGILLLMCHFGIKKENKLNIECNIEFNV